MPANLEFLKDQVLVAKSFTYGPNGRQGITQVVFIGYFPAVNGVNCTVRDAQGIPQKVNSSNLANIMWAEQVLAAHQQHRRPGGF